MNFRIDSSILIISKQVGCSPCLHLCYNITMDTTRVQICIRCGKQISGLYGSGRFCDVSCARAWSAVQNLEEANKKRSASQKGRIGRPMTEAHLAKMLAGKQKNYLARKAQQLDKRITVGMMSKSIYVELDITNRELRAYREIHSVCEICGKNESIVDYKNGKVRRLAIDHNHATNRFRGLLCTKCNMNLDWFIENQKEVLSYANR
jgi:hypothetical protein